MTRSRKVKSYLILFIFGNSDGAQDRVGGWDYTQSTIFDKE